MALCELPILFMPQAAMILLIDSGVEACLQAKAPS